MPVVIIRPPRNTNYTKAALKGFGAFRYYPVRYTVYKRYAKKPKRARSS